MFRLKLTFSSISFHRIIVSLYLALFPWSLLSQDYHLEFRGPSSDLDEIEKYNLDKQSNDSLMLMGQVNQLKVNLQETGFLKASIQTAWIDKSHLVADVQLGSRYKLTRLDPGNVDPSMLQKVGYRDRQYANKPFEYGDISQLLTKLIRLSGDAGYPFASVHLDSVQVIGTEVSARLSYDPGPLITFDSIVLTQPLKINLRFLQAYLKMQTGTPFSETVIEELPNRLDKLTFLRLMEEPGLTFQNDQASTYLDLQPIKSNQVDGIIGFLPNSKEDGGLLLTGQFNLLLQNMFGSGRSLGLQWESFKSESQLLNINFHQPILFRSPIDLDLTFNLLKEDSTFVNRLFNIDLGYNSARHFVGIFSHLKTARLPSTGFLEDITTFPDLADFNLNQFGASYRWDNLDSQLSPKAGISINTQASIGTKKIKKNSAITDSLYQDLDLETSQYSWEVALSGFIPVSKHWVIAGKWSAAGVYNDRLFFNDLYRLGGLKTLRGFSENTFFAENFAYSSVEPRFFFETNSYLFVFYDQAWWLNYSLESNKFKDSPSGFGAGISLTTKAGIFNFVWAVGKSKIQEIGFDQSKIHFGYVSRF